MTLGATIALLAGCILLLAGIGWVVFHAVRASGPKDRR